LSLYLSIFCSFIVDLPFLLALMGYPHYILVWGVILIRVFIKKNFFRIKWGSQRIYFRIWRDNKDGFSSFQAQMDRSNRFCPYLVWLFFHKDLYFCESMTSKTNYMWLCIQLKYRPRDMRYELSVHFSFFASWFKIV